MAQYLLLFLMVNIDLYVYNWTLNVSIAIIILHWWIHNKDKLDYIHV